MKARWSSWSRRRKAGLLLGVGTLAVAGVALAAWLTSGTGNTQVHGGQLQALVVTPQVPGEPACFPGQTCALAFDIDNPNSSALTITGIVPAGTPTTTAPGCPGSSVHVFSGASSGLSIPLPANAVDHYVTIPTGAEMDAGAPTQCQGAVFLVPATVTASTN